MTKEEIQKEIEFHRRNVGKFCTIFIAIIWMVLLFIHPLLALSWLAIIALGLAWVSHELKKDAEKKLNEN